MVIAMWTSYNSNTVCGIRNNYFSAEDSDACKQPDTKPTGMKILIIVHRGPGSLIQSSSHLCKNILAWLSEIVCVFESILFDLEHLW